MNFERLTSEEMDRLLARLGFRLTPSEGPQRVFENSLYDAVLLLPPAGREPLARPEHILTLRKAAEERGIADADTFQKLLNEVRAPASEPLEKAS